MLGGVFQGALNPEDTSVQTTPTVSVWGSKLHQQAIQLHSAAENHQCYSAFIAEGRTKYMKTKMTTDKEPRKYSLKKIRSFIHQSINRYKITCPVIVFLSIRW